MVDNWADVSSWLVKNDSWVYNTNEPTFVVYLFANYFMKSRIVSSFLLIVLTAYITIPALPVIDYLINKNYIAKNLCVNRDKPKSCCKGKCFMVKQLQKTNKNSENDTKNTNKRIQLKELNEFILAIPGHSNPEIINIKYLIYNTLAFNQLACSAIFVPPKSVNTFL